MPSEAGCGFGHPIPDGRPTISTKTGVLGSIATARVGTHFQAPQKTQLPPGKRVDYPEAYLFYSTQQHPGSTGKPH